MSELNWKQLFDLIQILGIAYIGYLVARTKTTLVARQEKMQAKIAETQENIVEVKKIVDGPLSVALKSNADMSRKIAELTGKHEDLVVAVKAEAVNRNREEGKV